MPKGKPKYGQRKYIGLRAQYPLEYITWQNMLRRCEGFGRSGKLYQRRGITVCRRWKGNFAAFIADMGPKPKGPPRYWSIERKNNNKGYSPANCRWATPKEQAQNRSQNGPLPKGLNG